MKNERDWSGKNAIGVVERCQPLPSFNHISQAEHCTHALNILTRQIHVCARVLFERSSLDSEDRFGARHSQDFPQHSDIPSLSFASFCDPTPFESACATKRREEQGKKRVYVKHDATLESQPTPIYITLKFKFCDSSLYSQRRLGTMENAFAFAALK